MSYKNLIQEFYTNAINNKVKTRASLAPYVTDEALLDHVDMFESAFPKYSIQIEDMIEEGDKLVVRARFQGKHLGTFNGIDPTGKSVDLPFVIIYRMENNKIVEHWLMANFLEMLTQLGVMNMAEQNI